MPGAALTHRRPPDHDIRRARISERLRMGMWLGPAVCVTTAILANFALAAIDDRLGGDRPSWLVFGRGPDSAQQVLSTIAGSTLAFTGVVFSITIVALQLASSQFSPRILRNFLRDPRAKWTLGVFLSTFVFALMTLRLVRTDAEPGEMAVPGITVTVAFLLSLASLAGFVYLVHHVANSIRVATIIEVIAHETRHAIRECYPTEPDPLVGYSFGEPPSQVVTFERGPGTLLSIDEDDLVRVAAEHGVVFQLVHRIGDFLPSGMPLFEVHGGTVPAEAVLPHVLTGTERTFLQDPAFGFRQLVDIAEKALSPTVNDPTTAVQCIDRLHDLLRRLAVLPQPSGCHVDATGAVRLVAPIACWDDFVELACDEIRQYGGGTLQVQRRMRAMLDDLDTVASQDRRVALDRQRDLLERAAAREFRDDEDRELARHADEQGLGS